MTTLELFRKHRKGEVSRDRFLYEVRRDSNLPWVTNTTSYDDAVKILKNKGIIREESINENFEVHYSDGIRQSKTFKDLNAAKAFAKQLIQTNKQLQHVDIFKAGPKFHSTADSNALVAWWGPGSYFDNLSKKDSTVASKTLKEAQFEPQNIPTDPVVDRVNPYALKREVEKLLAKETELTNDSYKQALNKAAKKLTDPQAVKKAMFANADTVERADAKLQTQEVKKGNLKDKHNEMKKVKGQTAPKATASSTKENRKGKPKGVEVMKDKGVEGTEKIIKEAALSELTSFLKKKLNLSEDVHYEYHVGSEVHLPEGGTGKIVEIRGGTCTVEIEDGTHRDIQMNVLGHAKKKAMEAQETPKTHNETPVDEAKTSDIKAGQKYHWQGKEVEITDVIDNGKKIKAIQVGRDSVHEKFIINDPENLTPITKKEINEAMVSSLEERINALEDAQYLINKAIRQISAAVQGTSIDRNVQAYTIAHLDNWTNGGNPYDMTIPKIIETLSEEGEEDLDEYTTAKTKDPLHNANVIKGINASVTDPRSKTDLINAFNKGETIDI